MNFRTDLADELINKKTNEYTKESKTYKHVKQTTIKILKDKYFCLKYLRYKHVSV